MEAALPPPPPPFGGSEPYHPASSPAQTFALGPPPPYASIPAGTQNPVPPLSDTAASDRAKSPINTWILVVGGIGVGMLLGAAAMWWTHRKPSVKEGDRSHRVSETGQPQPPLVASTHPVIMQSASHNVLVPSALSRGINTTPLGAVVGANPSPTAAATPVSVEAATWLFDGTQLRNQLSGQYLALGDPLAPGNPGSAFTLALSASPWPGTWSYNVSASTFSTVHPVSGLGYVLVDVGPAPVQQTGGVAANTSSILALPPASVAPVGPTGQRPFNPTWLPVLGMV